MTKAEFLELRAGEQRWVLLSCLKMVCMTTTGVGLTLATKLERQAAAELAGVEFEKVVLAATEEGL